MKETKNDFYEFARPVLLWTGIVTAFSLAGTVFANETERSPYGYTWQVKCEQSEDGREVVCWRVEVPNKPVAGIDIPFPKEDK